MSSLLLQHLTQEHTAVAEFLDLLTREADAMTQGHFTALQELAERKSKLADSVALLGRQRENEQMRLGYKADLSGAEAAAAAGGQSLTQAWKQLRECAAQAHALNHANGVMIHAHLDFTRQAISFLKASGKPLYGPDGAHEAGAASGNRLAVG
ncbi:MULTISPECIES: flagella synthesis protein FlgN [unclassified Polaromonas]|uniref:flagella synthesis protein FlgN n=1 Tax=unclassified Polaromonas TaxID=2638319 RepID=UPI0018CB02BA|nr:MULTISPECIES: flagellar protein FlgN [unclassified Polaromonas]MBG6070461.1 flagella synthesis protein FlgN [Polaromonas sp. CG_9.7]MBG6112459.1 flagella synthesis protein FlgN [Polaromonas sp. CG_9.2]